MFNKARFCRVFFALFLAEKQLHADDVGRPGTTLTDFPSIHALFFGIELGLFQMILRKRLNQSCKTFDDSLDGLTMPAPATLR
jgi:hypothetical protein